MAKAYELSPSQRPLRSQYPCDDSYERALAAWMRAQETEDLEMMEATKPDQAPYDPMPGVRQE